MPQAIATAALSWVATTGITVTAAIGAAVYYGTYYVAQTVILGSISRALIKQPSFGGGGIGGTTVTGRSPIAPRQIIYGRTRVGGNTVYMEGTNSNKYLHIVIAFAGHEVDAVEKIYFNDEEVVFDGSGNVTTGSYANRVRIKTALGTDDQVAFADLVSESDGKWTSNHRLRGVAAVYVRLEYDKDKFFGGVPNISALIRGKKVYDPRTGSTTWSQNPALCLNDYLTNTDYGLGCVYASEIDASALIAAANICDEDVALDAGGTENAYELNGSFNTSATPETIINSMLTSMIGKAVWSGGKWRILAGSYYTPTLDFDEGDLRAGFRVQTRVSRRENFNSVKGTHPSSLQNYIATEFPAVIGDGVTNATMGDYIAEDNGETVYKTIELPFTVSPTMAQRISKIELERARQQITMTLPLKLVGLKARVGDVITVTNTRMGWVSKPFEVTNMTITYNEEMGVDLDLRETAPEVYDWTVGTDEKTYDPAPNTNLPSAFTVGEVTDIRFDTTTNYTEQYGTIEWDCSDLFVTRYKVVVDGKSAKFDLASSAKDTSVELFARAKRTTMINGKPYLLGYILVTNPEVLTIDKYVAGSYIRVYGSYTKSVDWDGALTEYGTLITAADTLNDGTFRIDIQSPLKAYEVYKAGFGGGLFLQDDGAGGTGLIATQAITPKDPSINVYYEQEVTQKYFNGVNFVSGSYIVSVTPYNYLGVAGSTTSSWLYIPYPPIPSRVSGLELDLGAEGEGNATQWTGKDVKIKWRQASFTLSSEINDTEPNGAEYGANDEYLKDYKVAVYKADGTLLREEYVTTTSYVYSFEKNAEDAAKRAESPYRTVSFKVWARGKQNQISEQAATL